MNLTNETYTPGQAPGYSKFQKTARIQNDILKNTVF